jgi:two-component system alkaline phosphatase synthesis response regulator PhoP
MKKILVVDDEPDILETMSLLLDLEGYQVATAANGQDALSKASSYNPDLVITDIMMPEMDGHELIDEIKKRPETSKTPVIAMSAAGSNVKRVSQKFDAFLKKPIDLDVLLDKIHELVD